MNGKHQLLVYADGVNILGENLRTIRENTEIFTKASKDIGSEINSEKPKYMNISRHQSIVQTQSILIENLSFENLEKFKDLGVTVSNTNNISEETKSRINMGNVCYYSLEKNLSSRLLLYCRLYCPYGCKTWSLTLREEHRLRVFENIILRKIF